MSDKVRGALFNMLGDIEGLTVLDAFAGSGALSFEAISRGASGALAVEVDKNAHMTITENVRSLGLTGAVKAIRASARGWSDNNPSATFDLVLLDPPYDDLQPNLLVKLSRHLRESGVLVLSWPGDKAPPDIPGLSPVADKSYGDAQIIAYKRP